jgi:hypothetical protein
MSTPDYKPAQMLWMDLTGCSDSYMPGREGYYEYRSPGWKSSIGGRLLSTNGHMHDGGVFTTLYINDKPVCVSTQLYGTKDEFKEKGDILNVNDPASSKVNHGGHSKTKRYAQQMT